MRVEMREPGPKERGLLSTNSRPIGRGGTRPDHALPATSQDEPWRLFPVRRRSRSRFGKAGGCGTGFRPVPHTNTEDQQGA